MRVLKLYSAATSTTNAAANIQFPRRGRIVGVKWSLYANVTTTAGSAIYELSFGNSGQQTTNDTVGPIDHAVVGMLVGAAGAARNDLNQFTPMNVPVNAGDRIYLNVLITGTVSSAIAIVTLLLQD